MRRYILPLLKPETRDRTKGLIAAFVAVAIWSSVYGIKSALLVDLGPSEVIFMQSIFAVPMLAVLAKLQHQKLKIPLRKASVVLLAGMFGIALYQIMVNYGIAKVGSVVSAIFSGLMPPLCLLMDMIFLHRWPTTGQKLSILSSTIGILMVVGFPGEGEFSLIGYLILFLSDIVWVLFCNFNQKIQVDQGINGPVLLLYQSVGALIVLFPMSMVTLQGRFELMIRPDIVAGVFMLTLLNSVMAYLLLNYTLKRLGVVYCNIIFNLVPVFTILLDFILYTRVPGPIQLIGTILVVLSVVFAK